jgi:galactose mutarotase-like enzyme
MSEDVVLESGSLRVTVRPRVGGTITSIHHKETGLSVLGTVPWEPVDAPLESGAAPDEQVWLTRYTGGWPLLFPNGGDACTFEGVFHGFHGEASISPWEAESSGMAIRLTRRFITVPVRMRREISVDGDLLTIRETAELEGNEPTTVMWGHHPTFGSDLLAGEFEIQSGARSITVDEEYDPPTNPLWPGATGTWPEVQGKGRTVDLRRPLAGSPDARIAALIYLHDFDRPWISIRRLDNAVAATLSWDASMFHNLWLWLEIGGTSDAPWLGRARLIGLEPSTTRLAYGLAEASQRDAGLLTLQPGFAVSAVIRLHVSIPSGVVSGVGLDGRSRSSYE